MDWQKLAKRFHEIVKDAEGPRKFGSGSITVTFNGPYNPTVSVSIGAYDIADWPRHLEIGTFDDEKYAFTATEIKIDQAERIVKAEKE